MIFRPCTHQQVERMVSTVGSGLWPLIPSSCMELKKDDGDKIQRTRGKALPPCSLIYLLCYLTSPSLSESFHCSLMRMQTDAKHPLSQHTTGTLLTLTLIRCWATFLDWCTARVLSCHISRGPGGKLIAQLIFNELFWRESFWGVAGCKGDTFSSKCLGYTFFLSFK